MSKLEELLKIDPEKETENIIKNQKKYGDFRLTLII